MAVFTEGRHAGEHILSEADSNFSRDAIVVASGQGRLAAGSVLGAVAVPAGATAVVTQVAGAGKGALTMASPAVGAGVRDGVYRVVFIEPAANAGAFQVEDPDGVIIGSGNVAAAFDGVVKFTIADGATDFVAGDFALITVDVPTSSVRYVLSPAASADGSHIARAVLLDGVDATSAEAAGVAHTRMTQLNGARLTYHASVDDAAKRAEKAQQLAAAGLIVR